MIRLLIKPCLSWFLRKKKFRLPFLLDRRVLCVSWGSRLRCCWIRCPTRPVQSHYVPPSLSCEWWVTWGIKTSCVWVIVHESEWKGVCKWLWVQERMDLTMLDMSVVKGSTVRLQTSVYNVVAESVEQCSVWDSILLESSFGNHEVSHSWDRSTLLSQRFLLPFLQRRCSHSLRKQCTVNSAPQTRSSTTSMLLSVIDSRVL